VHSGVEKARLNASVLEYQSVYDDFEFDWVDAHSWLTVACGDSRLTGTVNTTLEEWWRLYFSTTERSDSSQAAPLAACFNGQGAHTGAGFKQLTSNITTGFSYITPSDFVTISPSTFYLASVIKSVGDFNLTLSSKEVATAAAAAGGGISWEDLPLNLDGSFSDASAGHRGLSDDALASIEILLAVGSFEGAPCSSTNSSGSLALTCLVSGALPSELSQGGIAISFNGGYSYTDIDTNFTTFSIDANFSSVLVGSSRVACTAVPLLRANLTSKSAAPLELSPYQALRLFLLDQLHRSRFQGPPTTIVFLGAAFTRSHSILRSPM